MTHRLITGFPTLGLSKHVAQTRPDLSSMSNDYFITITQMQGTRQWDSVSPPSPLQMASGLSRGGGWWQFPIYWGAPRASQCAEHFTESISSQSPPVGKSMLYHRGANWESERAPRAPLGHEDGHKRQMISNVDKLAGKIKSKIHLHRTELKLSEVPGFFFHTHTLTLAPDPFFIHDFLLNLQFDSQPHFSWLTLLCGSWFGPSLDQTV